MLSKNLVHFLWRHTVIELKKPNIDAGLKEKSQIESYASRVASDRRFPKGKTKWKFILVTKDIKTELAPLLKQTDRRQGHIAQLENCDVFILTWGDIINEAKIRLEYIKDKLNINLQENQQGLSYIKNKYKEYLPEGFANEVELEVVLDENKWVKFKTSCVPA